MTSLVALGASGATAFGQAPALQPIGVAGPGDPAGWQVPSQILRAVPTTAGDSFGAVAAMNREGDVLVVGAPNTRLSNANGVGAVHIFERSEAGAWVHRARIFCPLVILPGGAGTQTASFAQFGSSVAASGKTVVVGAWGYSGLAGPSFGGRAFVYTRAKDGQWGVLGDEDEIRPNAELVSDEIAAIDLFGYAVGVHVDAGGAGWIAVGSSLQGATDTGAVYIFEGSGSNWTQVAKVAPSGLQPRDNFGSKIAVGERTLVAGVQNADTDNGGVNAGLAYLFRRGSERVGSGTWPSDPVAVLDVDPASANPGDAFGCAVAVSGDGSTVVVGATGVDNAPDGTIKSGNGAAFVFTATDKAKVNWSRSGVLFPRESNANNAFGFAVDVSSDGQVAVIGCPGYDASAINSGCAFGFRVKDAVWVIEDADLWATSALLNQSIGRSVTLSGDGQRATAGSEYPNADPSAVFAWTYDSTSPSGDTYSGTPPTPDAPGADQVAGGGSGGNTTGSPSGGGTPSTGLGGGGQQTATPVAPTVYPWGVARNSIVLVNRGARTIGIVPTDGLQRGGDTSFISMGTYPEGLVPLGVGDINGDRTSDVLFLQPATNKVFMWEREGTEWNSPAPRAIGNAPAGATFAGIGDLNSDRVDDLAWYVDGQIFVQFTSGSTFGNSSAREFPAGNWRFFVSRALLAQSGTGGSGGSGSEIVAFDSSRGVALRMTVSGSGEISEPQQVPVPESGWVLAGVGDVNRDGIPDMLWTEGDGGREWRFVIMRSDGSSSSIVRWDSQKRGWRLVALVDWDNNGTVDPMVARDGYVIVLLNQWNTQASGFGYISTPAVEYIQEDVPDGYSVLGFGAQ